MKPLLTLPSPHWPCMWGAGQDVRMACPQCGSFTLHLRRSDDGREVKSLSCEHCGLHGVAAVQRKMNAVAALIAAKSPQPVQPEAVAQ